MDADEHNTRDNIPNFFTEKQLFNSFEELKSAIEKYESTNFCKLYTRRSRTIASAKKRTPKKSFNKDLKFTELELCCIHGGKNFKSRSTGQRPNQSTFQKGCTFSVLIKTSDDGQKLIIKSMSSGHNHSLSKMAFDHLPQSRKLSAETIQLTKQMIRMKANKKVLRDHLVRETGKIVLLKDLHNLASETKRADGDFDNLSREMRKDLIKSVERDHRAVIVQTKVPVTQHPCDSIMYKYQAYLTPDAFQREVKQITLLTSKNFIVSLEENGLYRVVQTSGASDKITNEVTGNSCSCSFWKTMTLPCHHILACRQHLGLDQYAPELCAERWRKDNNTSAAPTTPNPVVVNTDIRKTTRVLSQHEKYRKTSHLLQNISSVVSKMGMKEFVPIFDLLKTVEGHISNGREFIVTEVTGTNNNSCSDEVNIETPLEEETEVHRVDEQSSEPSSSSGTVKNFIKYIDHLAENGHLHELAVEAKKKRHLGQETLKNSTKSNAADQQSLDHRTNLDRIGGDIEDFVVVLAKYESLIHLKGDVHSGMVLIELIMTEFLSIDESTREKKDVADDSFRAAGCEPVTKEELSEVPLNNESKIKIPPTIRRRGRPKGAESTVVGLPRKKSKISLKPEPFIKLPAQKKKKV